MKKLMLFIALISFTCTFHADAQMKVKKFGIALGQDWDMLPGLSAESLLAKTNESLSDEITPLFDLSNGYQYSSACDNPNIRLSLVLEPQFCNNIELHTSGVFIFNRMDAVYLYDNSDRGYRNLSIISHGNEIDLEGVLIKKVPVLGFLNWKFMNLYGGIGANAGYQFGNYLSVWGSDGEYSTGRWGNARDSNYIGESTNVNDGISARVFAQAGFGITIMRRIELGLEGRYGAGFRHYFATDTDFTNLHSVAFTMKYVLGAKKSKAERRMNRTENLNKARNILQNAVQLDWQ